MLWFYYKLVMADISKYFSYQYVDWYFILLTDNHTNWVYNINSYTIASLESKEINKSDKKWYIYIIKEANICWLTKGTILVQESLLKKQTFYTSLCFLFLYFLFNSFQLFYFPLFLSLSFYQCYSSYGYNCSCYTNLTLSFSQSFSIKL